MQVIDKQNYKLLKMHITNRQWIQVRLSPGLLMRIEDSAKAFRQHQLTLRGQQSHHGARFQRRKLRRRKQSQSLSHKACLWEDLVLMAKKKGQTLDLASAIPPISSSSTKSQISNNFLK